MSPDKREWRRAQNAKHALPEIVDDGYERMTPAQQREHDDKSREHFAYIRGALAAWAQIYARDLLLALTTAANQANKNGLPDVLEAMTDARDELRAIMDGSPLMFPAGVYEVNDLVHADIARRWAN